MITPKNLETVLVKAPHRKEVYTEDELLEFAACADPVTGPLYFMDHFFNIQHPTRGKMLYHPFEYQTRLIEMAPFVSESDVYICGPAAWTKSVEKTLHRVGTPASQIHAEEFAW
jgi:ferredoxin-NADP reductase